jgi:hypothetical protein
LRQDGQRATGVLIGTEGDRLSHLSSVSLGVRHRKEPAAVSTEEPDAFAATKKLLDAFVESGDGAFHGPTDCAWPAIWVPTA